MGARFFNIVRNELMGGRLNQTQVDNINQILKESNRQGLMLEQKAYVLATVHHETGRKMQAVEEGGKGRGKRYGRKIKYNGAAYEHPDQIYYGRGHVQLTWYENYELFGRLLDLPLLEKPELMLNMDVSIQVLGMGMRLGLFTGVGLNRYINHSKKDYVNARRIINGLDRAELIAGYAETYERALKS